MYMTSLMCFSEYLYFNLYISFERYHFKRYITVVNKRNIPLGVMKENFYETFNDFKSNTCFIPWILDVECLKKHLAQNTSKN